MKIKNNLNTYIIFSFPFQSIPSSPPFTPFLHTLEVHLKDVWPSGVPRSKWIPFVAIRDSRHWMDCSEWEYESLLLIGCVVCKGTEGHQKVSACSLPDGHAESCGWTEWHFSSQLGYHRTQCFTKENIHRHFGQVPNMLRSKVVESSSNDQGVPMNKFVNARGKNLNI